MFPSGLSVRPKPLEEQEDCQKKSKVESHFSGKRIALEREFGSRGKKVVGGSCEKEHDDAEGCLEDEGIVLSSSGDEDSETPKEKGMREKSEGWEEPEAEM